jgi:GH35 family endo-1,4-beta-xylanase
VGAGATGFANWPRIEPEPGEFDWSPCDNDLKGFNDPEGLSLLPIFGYTPKWASKNPDAENAYAYPPSDVRTLSRFVFEIVKRYQHRVKVWEVWNEPNIGFLHGSIAEYAEMVKAAAVAAKKADPTCRIAMGCAGVDVDFLRRLYELGCGPFYDVMSVHPYQWGTRFNDGWMIEKLTNCRRLMDEFGDAGKEIWLTELGWSLSEGVTAEQQANLLVQAVVTALTVRERLKVEKTFWFCIKDWGGPGHGLLDVDGKPKPAFAAYTALTTALQGARYLGAWRTTGEVRAHVFDRGGKPVLVLWNPAPDGIVAVELLTKAEGILVRTVTNDQRDLAVTGGKATLEAAHAPVFVTGFAMGDLEVAPVEKAQTETSLAQPEAPKGVWLSVVPPDSTLRPYLVLDAFNAFPLRIHNDSDARVQGEISLELRGRTRGVRGDKRLAGGKLPFSVDKGAIETVVWQIALPALPENAGELATLAIRGTAGQELDPVDLPVRLVRGRTIEFLGNSFTERQYLREGGKSGCAESIRFGSEWTYRFDLRDAKWAELRLLVGAHMAQEWHVSLSRDEKAWDEAASGRSWPAWRTVDLPSYLPEAGEGGNTSLFVKIHGDDCQLRELILETEQPMRPKQVNVYQKSPTELVVWDARPELGVGMHQMPDEQIDRVRKLGVRFVRHTLYWYQVEKTGEPGKYDAEHLAQWDDLVRRCERQGVVLVVVVHGNPPGVSFANRPAGYRRFATFMGDMAKRYPQIRYWELWNEMDVAFTDLFGAQNGVPMRERGRLYAEMLKLAYPAIKEANPEAWVLVGGMTDTDEFPRGLYEGGGRDYFDLMNIHTYGVPVMWSFSARGQRVRRIMDEFGDDGKPLWNTEFGIDAGNFVGAWGYPHSWSPPQKDDAFFDAEQRRQWEACLEKNRELGLYAKVLPYQFQAGNERDDDKRIKERAQLPPGMTIDDYGFGLVRSDGKTPRPTYTWLLEQQRNRPIQEAPSFTTDIRFRPTTKAVPVGYEYQWEGEALVIRHVKADSAFPTRIRLKEAE